MKSIPSSVYKSIRQLAEGALEGDWVLLGGALLPVLGIEIRVTTDIDLVPLSSQGNSSLSMAFKFSEQAHLPIESVNSAALYFLEKIPKFRDHLVVLHEWEKGRLYRPNLVLFLQLKLARFSESDYLDCVEMVKLEGSSIKLDDKKRLKTLLKEKKSKLRGDQKVWIEKLFELLE